MALIPFEDMPYDERRRMILDGMDLTLDRSFDSWQELGFFPAKGEHGKRNRFNQIVFSFDQVIPILSTESESR